jgi:hypothetical protein
MTGSGGPGFRTLEELRSWCEAAPAGTRLDAHAVAQLLTAVTDRADNPQVGADERLGAQAAGESWTWRERLWTVPAETRLGVLEVAEALGRPRSFVYARTQKNAIEPIPHRKLDGALVFAAGEVRAWVRAQEETPVAGAMESTPEEKRGWMRAV